ncbi:MAG: D-alanine--poly(phosphoribitol) ligase subunit DltA [Lactobacillus sp.]|nr:D-alanine--poly(phosphoribitol) ligase subunit DltA [Lactobacillus sp.]
MIKDVIKSIDQIAEKDPSRVCYDYLGETSTYGELKARSDAWASYIASSNVPAGEPILIWGDQSFEMVASFLGCVKSGHAYVPIASYSNAERLTLIQEVSEASFVIAINDLPDVDLSKLTVLKPSAVTDGASVSEDSFVEGDENYYIIFTSGTTGKPKGVQISHDNLLSFINWELKDFKLPEHPAFLAQAPYSFDLSVMSLYPALVTGGKLVVLPHEVCENFGKLFQVLPTIDFNVWVSTPSFAQLCFLDKTFDSEHHPELTHFLFCGEELPHSEVDTLKSRFPGSHIFNTYGPTEATVAVTQVEITDEILAKYDRLPIGIAKEDTIITIDESSGEKPGEGEILLNGPSVSKGYLNNPEKTEAAFFKGKNGYQSYRTGDAGFLDRDMLFYRGRIDFQIKFNGYRIELEEINFYLSKNEFVRYGVVAPKYDKDHKVKQLIAQIELNDGVLDNHTEKEVTASIRKDLTENVMPYMMPQRFVFRDALPISQNGKVDIKAVISEVNS